MKKKLFGLLVLMLFMQCSNEDIDFNQSSYSWEKDFFCCKGDISEFNDLFLYLKQEDRKSPFIKQFQNEFGNPIWDNMTSISNQSSNSLYIPVVRSLQQNEIQTIWFFYFENGYVVYHPLQRSVIKSLDAESEWMFDYFTQTTLGKKTKNKLHYVPQEHLPDTKN